MSELDAERAAARGRVGSLILQCQSDDPAVEAAIHAALEEAVRHGWEDVRLALMHVMIFHRQGQDVEASYPLIAQLEEEARGLGMKAMEAIALVDRIRSSRMVGRVEPYQTFATARALLSDASQPPLDRVSGLINLALQFEAIGLVQLADETLQEAEIAAGQLPDGSEPLAVIAHNRARAFLVRAIDVLVGDEDRHEARRLLALHESRAEVIAAGFVPATWQSRLTIHRRIVEVLIDDIDIEPGEAEALIDSLAEVDHGVGVLVRLLTPRQTWPEGFSPTPLGEEDEALISYLHVRACRRGNVGTTEYTSALRRYADVMRERAARARNELAAGVSAMVSAQLLTAERSELLTQTLTDPLTGLANRRSFERCIQLRSTQPATLMLVDLDNFKVINDNHGHQRGDDVLMATSRALVEAASAHDPEVVARIGGDEFAIVFFGERRGTARRVADAFDVRLGETPWLDLSTPPTASIGVAAGRERAGLFVRADADLYEAKRRRPLEDQRRRTADRRVTSPGESSRPAPGRIPSPDLDFVDVWSSPLG